MNPDDESNCSSLDHRDDNINNATKLNSSDGSGSGSGASASASATIMNK